MNLITQCKYDLYFRTLTNIMKSPVVDNELTRPGKIDLFYVPPDQCLAQCIKYKRVTVVYCLSPCVPRGLIYPVIKRTHSDLLQ